MLVIIDKMEYPNQPALPVKLTSIQHEVLTGGLLGDFGMTFNARINKYPRFKVDRQVVDRPYLEWEFNIFKDLCASGIKEIQRFDVRYNKTRYYVSFRTRAIPAFLEYYIKWYPNNKKQVPKDLELTPLILAVWFADDGCIINEKNNLLTVKFSTESFGQIGAEILAQKLEQKYNVKFHLHRKKKDTDQFIIKVATCASQALLKEIEPYIIEFGMWRKYEIWKDLDLNVVPKIGHPIIRVDVLDSAILYLKDFSVKDIQQQTSLNERYIRSYIQKLFRWKFLDRYESTNKFNVYHYIITNLGLEFLMKEI
jgi:hypothetical protein